MLRRLVAHLALNDSSYSAIEYYMLCGPDARDPSPFVRALSVSSPVPAATCWLAAHDFLCVAIEEGGYDARARVVLRRLCTELGVLWRALVEFENRIAEELRCSITETDAERNERVQRERQRRRRRWMWVGAAAVVGGVVIGITGGLAAPLVGAAIGVGGAAFLSSTGGIALTSALFGTMGAGLSSSRMSSRLSSVKEFQFERLPTSTSAMHVVICITGFVQSEKDDFGEPWREIDDVSELYSLRWESKVRVARLPSCVVAQLTHEQLISQMGTALAEFISSQAAGYVAQQILMHTLLAGLLAAVSLPMSLLSLGFLIDNVWSTCIHRADECGRVLADVLLQRAQGARPVVLIGFSFGARAIFSCLEELTQRRAARSAGIVQEAYLIGAPVPLEPKRWDAVAHVVAGRLVNAYSRTDWVLSYAYRSLSLQRQAAGVAPVQCSRIENVDLSGLIPGHLEYHSRMSSILSRLGLRLAPEVDYSQASERACRLTDVELRQLPFAERAEAIDILAARAAMAAAPAAEEALARSQHDGTDPSDAIRAAIEASIVQQSTRSDGPSQNSAYAAPAVEPHTVDGAQTFASSHVDCAPAEAAYADVLPSTVGQCESVDAVTTESVRVNDAAQLPPDAIATVTATTPAASTTTSVAGRDDAERAPS